MRSENKVTGKHVRMSTGPSLSGATQRLPLQGDCTRKRPSGGSVQKMDTKCTPAEETAAPVIRE